MDALEEGDAAGLGGMGWVGVVEGLRLRRTES